MTDQDIFQRNSDALIRWFLQNPLAKFNPKVELADLRHRGAGRGLVALADIDEDEELFVIPRSSVLSVETSELKGRMPKEIENLDPWLALILVMIYEHLQGPRSKWKPYFDVLPETFDTLMFWSNAELSELQGSAVLQKIGKIEADKTFRKEILPRIQAHPDLFVRGPAQTSANVLSEAECLALAHRMGSLILAYSFDIEKDEDNSSKSGEDGFVTDDDDEDENLLTKGMVPMADMLNADADRNNARLYPTKETLLMQATKPIPKGTEIFNDYGPLPQSDLLRRYGYLTENYAKYDVVELPTSMIIEEGAKYLGVNADEQYRRYELLRENEILEDSGYDLCLPTESTSAFPDELLVAVETFLLPEERLSGHHLRKGLPEPAKTEGVVAVLREVIRRRQQCYATTLEQDEVMIQNDLSGRKLLAVQVRLGEKRILNDALDELDRTPMIPENNCGYSNRGNRTSKRLQGSNTDDGNKRSKLR